MVVRQGFFSFFNCSSRYLSMLWSVKLYFKHSSSHILECNSFISRLLRWCYVIVDNFPSCSMIHRFLRARYLNPSFSLCSSHLFNQSISSLELSWVIFHLKLSQRFVAIYGAYTWPKFFIYPPGEISFSSPCSYQSNLVSIYGRISPQVLRCFHKPTSTLLFSLLIFQQLRSSLLRKVVSFKFICGRSCDFLLRSFLSINLDSILSFQRHCDLTPF